MVNELGLMVKNDIPFNEAQLTIHQPSVKEIGLIGEEDFFIGCQLLTVSKDKMQDKSGLEQASNFDIFMSIVQDKNPVSQKNRICAQQVLLLLFPNYKINFMPRSIAFVDTRRQKPQIRQIDSATFDKFGEYLKTIFLLNTLFRQNGQYDIDQNDKKAKALKEKFDRYHRLLAKKKSGEDGQTNSIFSRYISILAVGENKSINTLRDYTVYQLLTQFQRYTAKQEFDVYIQAKMAGAKDLKEVKNWMGNLDHPDDT